MGETAEGSKWSEPCIDLPFLVLSAFPSAPSGETSLEMGWGGAKRPSAMHQCSGPLQPSASSGMKALQCSSPLPLALVGCTAATQSYAHGPVEPIASLGGQAWESHLCPLWALPTP